MAPGSSSATSPRQTSWQSKNWGWPVGNRRLRLRHGVTWHLACRRNWRMVMAEANVSATHGILRGTLSEKYLIAIHEVRMAMRSLSYLLLDVFSSTPFGGNQLAVFLDAQGLADAEMQAIAREMNLSECTFVMPPTDPFAHHRVRIFTPRVELPLAGHPTVGTAFALAHAGTIPPTL